MLSARFPLLGVRNTSIIYVCFSLLAVPGLTYAVLADRKDYSLNIHTFYVVIHVF